MPRLGPVGVGEALAIVQGEAVQGVGCQDDDAFAAGGVADQHRPVGADHLHADVVPECACPRDVRHGEAALSEANRDDAVVEIPELLELGEDERLPDGASLDRFLSEKPAGRVVVVRGHVQQEAPAGPDPRSVSDVTARREHEQWCPDRTGRHETVRLHERSVEAPW